MKKTTKNHQNIYFKSSKFKTKNFIKIRIFLRPKSSFCVRSRSSVRPKLKKCLIGFHTRRAFPSLIWSKMLLAKKLSKPDCERTFRSISMPTPSPQTCGLRGLRLPVETSAKWWALGLIRWATRRLPSLLYPPSMMRTCNCPYVRIGSCWRVSTLIILRPGSRKIWPTKL